MSAEQDRRRWNQRYRARSERPESHTRLGEYVHLLRGGRALDLGAGLGRNADLLGGWSVILVDISDVAMRLATGARVVADAEALPFPESSFETIVCTFFKPPLDLARFLRPGGTLFLETFTMEDGKYRPDFPPIYRMSGSDVSVLFQGMITVHWEERDDGERVKGVFVGRKV